MSETGTHESAPRIVADAKWYIVHTYSNFEKKVAEEIRRGYKLRERLLRPSLVRVAHNPKQTSE